MNVPTGQPATEGVDVQIPNELITALSGKSVCYLATTMPDGSPQLTQTWVDTDGEHVLINTVTTHQKMRNVQWDPRVSMAISDPSDPTSYTEIRGRVIEERTEGAVEHIETLSQRYTGGPYGWWGGRDQTRVLLVIEATKINTLR